jgi:UDP-2,3-diacylglucosamine pyrophosphatase LpxH
MEFYEIKGIFSRLIRSYLSNRYQRVSKNKNVDKYYSDWKLIRHGVLQGSILGPLFFLLYINDLPNVISDISKPILYADDTSIIIFDKDSLKFKTKVHTVFDKINNWFQTNLLSLNLKLIFYSF